MTGKGEDVEALLSDPKRAMLHMAVPLFVTYLISRLQSFIDGIWCSGLGPDPLSAISISAPAFRIIVSLGIAIGVGASASIARYIGAGDKRSADRTASQALAVALVAAVAAIPAMLLASGPIISMSGAGHNEGLAMDYVLPYILCSVPLVFNGLVVGLMRAEGAARKSMVVSASASVINMALDPAMIYGLDMGITGAAWATCISYMITTVVGLSLYARGSMYVSPSVRGFRFEPALLRDMTVMTVPVALESILSCLVIAPEQGLVASCGGAEGLVVYVNSFSFVDLATIPSMALMSALIPVVSAQLGQKAPEKVSESLRYSMKLVLGAGIAFGAVLFLFADQLVSLYTYSEAMAPLHDEMAFALRIYSVVPVLNGVMKLGTSMLQAMRKAVMSTAIMFGRELMFILFFWFASRASMGAIYWSLDAVNLIMMSVVLLVLYVVMREYRSKASQGASI
ncbi:MAG: MATE family efflux transporter [Candidatus Methanomethylophilaceae archaeon]|nr:MATE family efflux transporter [Candidatus Methanomethylophilaceae archaeon]